jgi:hypothetical protein
MRNEIRLRALLLIAIPPAFPEMHKPANIAIT